MSTKSERDASRKRMDEAAARVEAQAKRVDHATKTLDSVLNETFGYVASAYTPVPFADRVRAETDAIARMLIEKNAAYGNSALDPLRVFSTAAAAEQIRVRIDDKLSRLARGSAAGEDVILDLIGYLILLRMAETKNP
jgi:hypothetical protein